MGCPAILRWDQVSGPASSHPVGFGETALSTEESNEEMEKVTGLWALQALPTGKGREQTGRAPAVPLNRRCSSSAASSRDRRRSGFLPL